MPAAPVRNVGGNMRRIMSVAAAVMAEMRHAGMPTAATAPVTATTAARMASAAPTARMAATASSPALGERHICRANRNPERAETCGKSQDDKMSPDRSHGDPPLIRFRWCAPPTS